MYLLFVVNNVDTVTRGDNLRLFCATIA